MGNFLKRALPWVVSLGLVAWLVATTDLDAVWAAIRAVPMVPLLAATVGAVVVSYLYDALCLTLVLRRFNAPVRYGEILPLKGASYFLNIVNYNAAAGGMALHLRRTRGVGFLEAASSFLFLNVADVVALCVLVTVGLLATGDVVSAEARAGLWTTVAVIGAALAGTWVYWNAGFDFLVLGRLRSWRIFHAFARARVADYGWLAALRLGLLLQYILLMWAYLWLFDIRVPLTVMFALHPIVILIWTVPVSIAGLGTVQLALRLLYAPFAVETLADPVPVIDACSTTNIFVTVLIRVAIGYACLRRISAQWTAGGAGPAGQEAPEGPDSGQVEPEP